MKAYDIGIDRMIFFFMCTLTLWRLWNHLGCHDIIEDVMMPWLSSIPIYLSCMTLITLRHFLLLAAGGPPTNAATIAWQCSAFQKRTMILCRWWSDDSDLVVLVLTMQLEQLEPWISLSVIKQLEQLGNLTAPDIYVLFADMPVPQEDNVVSMSLVLSPEISVLIADLSVPQRVSGHFSTGFLGLFLPPNYLFLPWAQMINSQVHVTFFWVFWNKKKTFPRHFSAPTFGSEQFCKLIRKFSKKWADWWSALKYAQKISDS